MLAALAANGNNVKRTARETGVLPGTIRRWRTLQQRGQGIPDASIQTAVKEFVDEAEEVRNLALTKLREKIESGDVKASELITTLGVLDDKITRARGLPTTRTEHTSALPSATELRELMAGVVQGAVEAATRRHEEIIEAEIVPELTPA